MRHKKLTNKEVYYLIGAGVVFLMLLLTVGTINQQEGISKNFDMKYYLDMAENSPGINKDVIPPFKYRILLPWLAGFGGNPASGFYILMVAGFLLQGISFILLFREKYGIRNSALAYTMMLLNPQISVFVINNPYNVVDLYASGLLIFFLYLMGKSLIKPAIMILVIAVFVKENFIIMIIAGLMIILKNKEDKGSKIIYWWGTAAAIAAAVLIRIITDAEGSSYLIYQVSHHVKEKLSDPFIILKTLILPGIFIVPFYIMFPEKLKEFIRENSVLAVIFIATFLSTFWGANDARLMTGAGVFYYGAAAHLLGDFSQRGPDIRLPVNDLPQYGVILMIIVNLSAVLFTNRYSIFYNNYISAGSVYLISLLLIFMIILFIKGKLKNEE